MIPRKSWTGAQVQPKRPSLEALWFLSPPEPSPHLGLRGSFKNPLVCGKFEGRAQVRSLSFARLSGARSCEGQARSRPRVDSGGAPCRSFPGQAMDLVEAAMEEEWDKVQRLRPQPGTQLVKGFQCPGSALDTPVRSRNLCWQSVPSVALQVDFLIPKRSSGSSATPTKESLQQALRPVSYEVHQC